MVSTGSTNEPGSTVPPGSPVRMQMQKWGGRAHWVFEAILLGSDEHGDWVGIPAGTHMSRPGADYVAPVDQVCLVPTVGRDVERAFLATFHAPHGVVDVYVDMATPPVWEGDVLTSIDLDLDVVRGITGRVWIDDEDEFADHRIRFGYPDDVVALASESCDRVHGLVTDRLAPFDSETSARWLAALRSLPHTG